jgi:hypothetical protein
MSAQVLVANNFTGIGRSSLGLYIYELNEGISAAIYIGLLGEAGNTTSATPFFCPTGNCTFPSEPENGASYQSLAIESACTDLSSSVSLNDSFGWYLPHLDPSYNESQPWETRMQRSVINNTFQLPADWNDSLLEANTPELVGNGNPVGFVATIRTILRILVHLLIIDILCFHSRH